MVPAPARISANAMAIYRGESQTMNDDWVIGAVRGGRRSKVSSLESCVSNYPTSFSRSTPMSLTEKRTDLA